MRCAPVITLTAALVVAGPTAVAVAGSDAPTPYTVTAEAVTLPAGHVFAAHNHVNYRVTALGGGKATAFGLHFDPNNGHPGGAYIGASTFDFAQAAEAFPAGYCVTWVQVDGFDEHFGEGGQEPVCTTTPPASPERPAVPEPPATPSGPDVPLEGSEEPAPPSPEDVTPPATSPEGETPSTDEPGTDAPRVDVPTHVETPEAAAPPADDATPADDEPDLVEATPVGNDVTAADAEDELATTGGSVVTLLAVGAALALGGALLLLTRRRA